DTDPQSDIEIRVVRSGFGHFILRLVGRFGRFAVHPLEIILPIPDAHNWMFEELCQGERPNPSPMFQGTYGSLNGRNRRPWNGVQAPGIACSLEIERNPCRTRHNSQTTYDH